MKGINPMKLYNNLMKLVNPFWLLSKLFLGAGKFFGSLSDLTECLTSRIVNLIFPSTNKINKSDEQTSMMCNGPVGKIVVISFLICLFYILVAW